MGYLSPDFREHPTERFVLPLLRAHDRRAVEVFCYADVAKADEATARFRAACDVWRDVSRLDEGGVAALVRRDRVDVLVDLAGHMDSRLPPVLTRRPAPVQVPYFGHPHSTGMACVGYRITDAWHDPLDCARGPGVPGETEAWHTERLVRIAGGCWCYEPGPLPEVGPLPAVSRGHVTLGVLNRLAKVTPQMVRLWARVLEEVPGSRLADFDEFSRVVLAPGNRGHYLGLFNRIDVALDTFPYNGMTTTRGARGVRPQRGET